MCGRFALSVSAEALMTFIGLLEPPSSPPRFNIAPTQPILVVRASEGRRIASQARWALLPSFMPERPRGAPLINARCETLFTKPSFRHAARTARCLVPASGFYEWARRGSERLPWLFQRPDGGPMAFAGIWEPGPQDGSGTASAAIVTTAANAVVGRVHHRMPVILHPRDFSTWLDPAVTQPQRLQPLLTPAPDALLVATALDGHVNAVRHEGPACQAPASAGAQGKLF